MLQKWLAKHYSQFAYANKFAQVSGSAVAEVVLTRFQITKEKGIDAALNGNEWLRHEKLVAKPDQLIKRCVRLSWLVGGIPLWLFDLCE